MFNLAIVGTGYVGLPTGIGFAQLGNHVVCVDNDPNKIMALKAGTLTLYEDGLEELFKQNVAAGRLSFTSSMEKAVKDADFVILAVGTPPDPMTRQADLQYIRKAAQQLAPFLKGYTVIANKSTVPVGTGDEVEKIISKYNPNADFDVVSLPEFLREGYAIHDFFAPDRIVIGTQSKRASEALLELYAPFKDKTEFLIVQRRSSETIKYASNAFLAVKIHYINEMANFCEKAHADISEVARGLGLDKRIGPKFLNPGPGYGGSCFPKDTMAMSYMANQHGVKMSLIDTTIQGNISRKLEMALRIMATIKDLNQPKIAIWGLAFKEGTDDCRQSPAMEIIQALLPERVEICAYDPQATRNAQAVLGDAIEYADSMLEAVTGADVLAILTEWPQFKQADLDQVASLMRTRNIVDCRNALTRTSCEALGFNYQGIGK